MFHVGQKVVCMNLKPGKRGLSPTGPGTKYPVVGGIYTIRDVFDARRYGHDDVGLLLEEVRNRPRSYTCAKGHKVRCEQFWLGFRFGPVRTTNIDVFKRMLEPVPVRRKEPAEAS